MTNSVYESHTDISSQRGKKKNAITRPDSNQSSKTTNDSMNPVSNNNNEDDERNKDDEDLKRICQNSSNANRNDDSADSNNFIELPSEDVFRNLKNARGFAIDIGGSLTKVAYCSNVQRKTSLVSDEFSDKTSDKCGIYEIFEKDELVCRLHFIKFETKFLSKCLDFIQQNLLECSSSSNKDRTFKATGGGAHKYKELITQKLGTHISKEDEIHCLIKGCNFLLKNIPDEAFLYQRYGNPECKFQGVDPDIYPFLLVNIGSGVSIIKVESENNFSRIGGTSIGGGTFWGLGSLLTGGKSFDELVSLAEKGDHRQVDMLVRDIYGSYSSLVDLPGDIIASSFGKAARSLRDRTDEQFKQEDVVRSLLLCISNDVGQIASLYAQLHCVNKVYFGGGFIRSNPFTMHTLSFAINYWSKGQIQALFLRHEGYLGAIGAFLMGAEEEHASNYCWGENFANSSGLASPRNPRESSQSSTFDLLELDRLNCELLPCPLLLDPCSYTPDTVDLTEDTAARDYWLRCLSQTVEKIRTQAEASQEGMHDVVARADKFKEKYINRLNELAKNPCAYGSLTVRSLLDTIGQFLKECMFTDPYSQLKQSENETSLLYLVERLKELDKLDWAERQLLIVKGILAGNVFDWGAREVVDIMESGQFGFSEAINTIQDRPWLVDDFGAWLHRRQSSPPYKCAAIFCDNSGADIILGIFPFIRDLLSSGTKVILCANSRPSLNDVLYNELNILVKRVATLCPQIEKASAEGQLSIMESGQGSPCLDLRLIDKNLANTLRQSEADLIVLEGMGRAIHTNFYASFSCDCLKVAVLKNKWLAQRLGGNIFNVIFKFETSRKIVSKLSKVKADYSK